MTQDRTLASNLRAQERVDDQGDPAESASPLLEQARGFAGAARQAVSDCKRGEEAIKELERRRNRSGQ